jgi:CheY-like chemotaxis protein/anti-sigma regulatory factor (Ser/Thr protein kinase)
MKDEFLAVLSHELRSPLNAIVGYAHLLKRWATDPELVLKAVEVVERNTRVQAQLIDDLLDTSRIAAGKIRLRAESVELPGVLAAAVDSIQPAAEVKGITIGTSGDAASGQLHGDPDRLQQIVGNLLSNAVKFTPPGGAVGVHVATDGTHVEIRVTDTGEGIDPEFLPHLFGRFRQADSSATRTHGGLGLGLALVKQLTELHGGTVEASSDGKGKGSVFTVRLPVAVTERAESGDETKPLVSEPVDLSGLAVLVVDDEPDALEILRRILEECGAEVITAMGADEALAQLDQRSVHVILSDIGMPVSDGYEFISTVRKQGMQTPAAAVTAFVRAEDSKRVLQAGYQAHVSKPIQPARLLNTVAALGGKLANA